MVRRSECLLGEFSLCFPFQNIQGIDKGYKLGVIRTVMPRRPIVYESLDSVSVLSDSVKRLAPTLIRIKAEDNAGSGSAIAVDAHPRSTQSRKCYECCVGI